MTINNIARNETVKSNLKSTLEVVVEAVNACSDAKAKDPLALNVKYVTDIAEYFIVMSGRSDRHAQGIANKVIDQMAKLGFEPDSIEGFETGHWILLDFDEIVVHVFYEPIRAKYDLEGLWSQAKILDLRIEPESKSRAA
ncbi:MAG: ribosome silencing factor [bacterium]|nr:ribosome silencing factor [bacterium]